ncbi:hypothetical protein M885DRAFT_588765 [Pelagophyceae sp. CCMP2097]|nr:hypothetical protein M885DRAFT_588765 [Pelagophyceae sp. CCMP2097]
MRSLAVLVALAGLCSAAAENRNATADSTPTPTATVYYDPCAGVNGTGTQGGRRLRGNVADDARLAPLLRGGTSREGPGTVVRLNNGAGGKAVRMGAGGGSAPSGGLNRCSRRKARAPPALGHLFTFLCISMPLNVLLGAFLTWNRRRNRVVATTVAPSDSDAEVAERRDELAKLVAGLQPATADKVSSDEVCAICLGDESRPRLDSSQKGDSSRASARVLISSVQSLGDLPPADEPGTPREPDTPNSPWTPADDAYGSHELVQLPTCRHVFHRDCVSHWVVTADVCLGAGKPHVFYAQRSLSCPVCSAPLLKAPPEETESDAVLEIVSPDAVAPAPNNV